MVLYLVWQKKKIHLEILFAGLASVVLYPPLFEAVMLITYPVLLVYVSQKVDVPSLTVFG